EVHVLRSALSPERLFEFIGTLDHERSVRMALVNEKGEYQVANPSLGDPLSASPFIVPGDQRYGIAKAVIEDERTPYGFARLGTSPWAVVIAPDDGESIFRGMYLTGIVLTVIFFIIGGIVIWVHAARTAGRQLEVEEHEEELSGQLVHAAKLASVGELAAGIAHEINNPLAIIAEEVGLLKDLMNPDFEDQLEEGEIQTHLDTIYQAVFRCRDITRKLLGFVRQAAVKLEEVDINHVMDEVTDNLLKSELTTSGIELIKKYCDSATPIITDRNQLEQVLLNLVKNAIDAMEGQGRLTVKTICRYPDRVIVLVRDTGCGMTPEQLNRIFTPFYTTKAPGKGTGLGLSVSYGIIKSLGGQMYVESEKGAGSTFTIELPLRAE
ncbi:histidine kinase, partial [bacterium]|nr:histidine kinase [bacterium]